MASHDLENGPCNFESAAVRWFHEVHEQGQVLPLLHRSLISLSLLSD